MHLCKQARNKVVSINYNSIYERLKLLLSMVGILDHTKRYDYCSYNLIIINSMERIIKRNRIFNIGRHNSTKNKVSLYIFII